MAYYYLLSSLPMLTFDGEMPFPYAQFLEMCRTAVSDSKYRELQELSLLSGEGALVSQWATFYAKVTAELTAQRNVRLGRKAQLPDSRDEGISKRVAAAMNNSNPLAAEEMLLALEFEKLDELVGTHCFDDVALMGYALKLKLLERKRGFQKEQGRAEFTRIVRQLEQQIMSMEQE